MADNNRGLEFRKLLYRLGENLTRQDLDSLTFMCRDMIPVARMERVRTATDLWQALTERGKLTEDDLNYLALLMGSIGKVNLLDDLRARGFPVPSPVKNPQYIFQESLLNVANNLSSNEVKELTYMFQSTIRLNPDKVFSATQLFQVLQQRQIISPTSLQPLYDGLVGIGRMDLTSHVSHYLPRHLFVHSQDPPPQIDMATPSSGVASYRQGVLPSMNSQESMSMSDHSGLTSIQESQLGHTAPATMVSPTQGEYPDAAFPPGTILPFGLQFNAFEGEEHKRSHILHPLSVKEGELRHKEEEIEDLKGQLAEQAQLGERILQDRNGECQAYSSSIQNLQDLLMQKNQEVTSLTEELQHYHQQVALIHAFPHRVEDFYMLDRQPHGMCVIFNNYNFYHPCDESKAHPYRGGANIDQGNLLQTFKYLRYNVVVKENLTAIEMQDAIFGFAQMDHTNFDSFVCCILTHGEANVVHGADSQEVNLQQFAATVKLCPSLREKPKLFFVQACRGELESKGLEIQKDSPPSGPVQTPTITATIPQDADFFFGYATPTGSAAYRSKRHGSWYISQLCKVLVNYAYTDNLSSMMKKVNNEVSDAYTKEGFKQCPEYVDRLRKKVHFFHFIKKQ